MGRYEDFEEDHNHHILFDHKNLIVKLGKEDRVFDIGYSEDLKQFYLFEMCDEWFRHTLTKDDCIELSTLFKEISELL